jgi:hypothetical protein
MPDAYQYPSTEAFNEYSIQYKVAAQQLWTIDGFGRGEYREEEMVDPEPEKWYLAQSARVPAPRSTVTSPQAAT